MNMNRRSFLRRSAIVAAGVVAADQIDLLDRLGWKRTLFPGVGGGRERYAVLIKKDSTLLLTRADWDRVLRQDHVVAGFVDVVRKLQSGPFVPGTRLLG